MSRAFRVTSAAARCGIALLILLGAGSTLCGESFTDQRVKSGIKIFRVILKGDGDIARKTTPDGAVVLLITAGDPSSARFADLLAEVQGSGDRARVAGVPVIAKIIGLSGLDAQRGPVAGVFVAESLGEDQLARAVRFGVDRHVITFSPFEGDVEKGVLCGLSVEAKLVPFINMRTLKASGISMSATLLKVAKPYE